MFSNAKKSRWQRRKEAKERRENEEKKDERKEEVKEEKEVPLWAQNAEVERRNAEPKPEHVPVVHEYPSYSGFGGYGDDYGGYSGYNWSTNNWGSGSGWKAYGSYTTSYTYKPTYTPTVKFEFTDDFKSNSSMHYFALEDVVKGDTCDFKIITTCVDKGEYETYITCDNNSKVVGKYKSEETARKWHKTYVTEEVPKHQKAFYMYTTVYGT